MTGFPTMARGSSFLKEFAAACRESSASKTPLVWAALRGRSLLGTPCCVILEPPRTHDYVQQVGHERQGDQAQDDVSEQAHSFLLHETLHRMVEHGHVHPLFAPEVVGKVGDIRPQEQADARLRLGGVY